VSPRLRARGSGPDHGSGVVLALGLIATTVILALAVVAWGAAALARHRAEAAADLAALAAASAPSAGCARAARVAAVNGGDLAGCQVNGDGSVVVRVTVRVAATVVGPGLATAVARAGQPP
jgi:secretion/DNA translocation related TadE-like protein